MTTRYLLLMTALAVVVLSGCSTDELRKQITTVQQLAMEAKGTADRSQGSADAAMAKAEEAMARADEASATAQNASATAQSTSASIQDLQTCCQDNRESVNRAFRRYMNK